MTIFTTTLSQMAFLFSLIVIGFILTKSKIVTTDAAGILAKLENNLFIPALVLNTFVQNFTVERLQSAWQVLLASIILLLVVIPLAIGVSKLMTKDQYIRNIYTYGLCFSNFGFMGNAVVSALFPDIFLEYLIFTLPLWMGIYLWGAPSLLMSDGSKQTLKSRLKSFTNPMFIAMLVGIILGLIGVNLPNWLNSVISSSANCMSPIAMLLTGITVANIDLVKTFKNGQIYLISLVRLLVFPLLFLVIFMFLPLPETLRTCAICSLAMPLGLNTIVIPSAYGKDTSAAAGMAIISHALSCITIPLVLFLLTKLL